MGDLYKEYGELMVQLEILQAKIQVVKQKIVRELNKKQEKSEEVSNG
jgi:hypothetical protein